MRKIIGILLCLSLLSCEQNTAPQESQKTRPLQFKQDIYPVPDSIFAVENNTHINVGWTSIQLNDGSVLDIDVPDSGMFDARLTKVAVSCTVNSQSLLADSATWIRVDMHTSIHATWKTNVVVIDNSEVN
jgi:hypothetical protein